MNYCQPILERLPNALLKIDLIPKLKVIIVDLDPLIAPQNLVNKKGLILDFFYAIKAIIYQIDPHELPSDFFVLLLDSIQDESV